MMTMTIFFLISDLLPPRLTSAARVIIHCSRRLPATNNDNSNNDNNNNHFALCLRVSRVLSSTSQWSDRKNFIMLYLQRIGYIQEVDGRLGDFRFPRKTATEAGQTAMMDYSSLVCERLARKMTGGVKIYKIRKQLYCGGKNCI